MHIETTDDSDLFVTEVCWLYYINGMTQSEIAKTMGATRLRVNQAIQKAKARGMVNIQIESPFETRVEKQSMLRERLGLSQALVVPADKTRYDYHTSVGAALGHHLLARLKTERWKRIGVSWGMSLKCAIERIPRQSPQDLEIIAFMGGTMIGTSFSTFSIASGFAEKLYANYSHLLAPICLPKDVNRDEFLQQDIFMDHINKCLTADATLLVTGDVTDKSYMVRCGLPEDTDPREIADAGAVGDILGRFVDHSGNEIDHPINRRIAGLSLNQLEKIPNKILTAAGAHKVDVILAVTRRNLVDTLITDDITAELILQSL